jgi:ATP-dependent DNA helicase DinG
MQVTNLDEIYNIYAENGSLASVIPNYLVRDQQLMLVNGIISAIANKNILLAEAGTGTGKTFAYLVPAILNDHQVVISTGTKNLQNQLYFRDLPLVIKALKLSIKTALLKGRSNYLCKYRLELAMTDLLLASTDAVLQLKQIVAWAESTNDGDTSTLADIPEDATIWGAVTSTADNCLSQDCPFINNCFVYKARQQAIDAKIIVINHHLLLSDWGIKAESAEAKLLPDGINLILDEAHQLPHIASVYFGNIVSSKKIKSLLQDIMQEQQVNAKDAVQLVNINKKLNNLLDQLQKFLSNQVDRGFYNYLTTQETFNLIMSKLYDEIQELVTVLQFHMERSRGMKLCYERAGQLFQDLKVFYMPDNLDKDLEHRIKWYEVFKQNFIFKQSPLEIGKLFSDNLQDMARSCVLTSATLSVGNSFELIKNDLGLLHADTLIIPSPFNYPQQSMLYIPRGMPDPLADNYIDCYIEQVLPVLESCDGQAFLLFTSFNAMHATHEKLIERFAEHNKYNILMQGQASKSSLLERFKTESNAILLATASFWEGVDVKGSDLHCVIIDKLPFASPSDPLLQAKINYLRKQGKNPFIDLQCQQAVLHLTQGAGRLIRSESDYGVLMICDPRILARPYGEMFLQSLPNMTRTRDILKIKQFYKKFLV